MFYKVQFLQIKLTRGLWPSLDSVRCQIAAFHAARNATIGSNIVAQLHHLDTICERSEEVNTDFSHQIRTSLFHAFQMLQRVNAQVAHPSGQSECVRAFGQQCGL